MFRVWGLLGVVVLIATACVGGNAAGAQTRTVLVDFSHDEFASVFLEYFPRKITVRPGDTIVFRQTWTGEPHSVTAGTVVDEMMALLDPFIEEVREKGWSALPEEPPDEVNEFFEMLPWMIGEDERVAQNAAQPCYLEDGLPPEDPDTACSPQQREQVPFNGRHSYYNSGFIPYEGPSGNTYSMPIADDIEPGSYFYYCNLHGPFQGGEIEVVPAGTRVPSQNDVNRQAREEIEAQTVYLRDGYEKALRGEWKVPDEAVERLRALGLVRRAGGNNYFDAPLSGFELPDDLEAYVHAGINEFIPRTIDAKVGEKISWVMYGGHTISFDVPRYFPIFEIDDDGTVRRNERLDLPAGGAPDPSPPEEAENGPEGDHDPEGEDEQQASEEEGSEEIRVIDGGTWGGRGFWSTGMVWDWPFAVYSLTITEPGTYRYACLVHPPMIGTVRVTPA